MTNDIEKLLRVTRLELSFENFPSLRGLACTWQDDTIHLFFYNNGPFCEDLNSDYCCLAGEIYAQFDSDVLLNEEVVRLDDPTPLPEHQHWAYQNPHASFSSSQPKISARHQSLLKAARMCLEQEKSLSWRGLAVDWDDEEIMLHLYYEGEPSADLSEKLQRLCNALSHECATKRLYPRSKRCDTPSPLPAHEYWAFLRDPVIPVACENHLMSKFFTSLFASISDFVKGKSRQISQDEFPSLRGVTIAEDSNKTLIVHYYNDGPISEELKEQYRYIGTEILPHTGCKRIHENFVRIDALDPLPQHPNWIYNNQETVISSLRPQISFKHKHLIATTQTTLSAQPLPYLRGIAVDWEGLHTVLMHCYHDRELTEKEKQCYQSFGEEVISHYAVSRLDQRILHVNSPEPLPEHEYWAFKK